MAQTTASNIKSVTFEDGQIRIEPRDQDQFFLSADKLMSAGSRVVKSDERFDGIATDFLLPLHQWCIENAAVVRACYITFSEDFLQVFVVQQSEKFDFEFARKVSALELKFASSWAVSIAQLPCADDDTLAAFIDFKKSWRIYA